MDKVIMYEIRSPECPLYRERERVELKDRVD
jgi:hypothetical protein